MAPVDATLVISEKIKARKNAVVFGPAIKQKLGGDQTKKKVNAAVLVRTHYAPWQHGLG